MDTKNKAAPLLAGNDGGTIGKTTTIPIYPDSTENATIGTDGGTMPDRFQVAADYENRVYDWLSRCDNIQCITRTGIEHTIPDSRFRDVLRSVISPEVAKWRFTPDFITIGRYGNLCYIEVKRSLYIEMDAYKHYIQLDVTSPVWLILESEGMSYWQRVSIIRFLDSSEYVRQFPNPFKVDPDGWILPRHSNDHSSCPFRVVDLSSMSPLDLEGE